MPSGNQLNPWGNTRRLDTILLSFKIERGLYSLRSLQKLHPQPCTVPGGLVDPDALVDEASAQRAVSSEAAKLPALAMPLLWSIQAWGAAHGMPDTCSASGNLFLGSCRGMTMLLMQGMQGARPTVSLAVQQEKSRKTLQRPALLGVSEISGPTGSSAKCEAQDTSRHQRCTGPYFQTATMHLQTFLQPRHKH